MPKVRLSGTVTGTDDPGRAVRARILYLLFGAGWDIYNSNGDQRITLSNIERKIIESEAFVFTPGATLEDMFKAISIFVGYQTLDRNLAGKPTVILNTDFSWDPLFGVLDHLNKMGTIKQDHRDFLLAAESAEGVLETLELVRTKGIPDAGRDLGGAFLLGRWRGAGPPACGEPPRLRFRGRPVRDHGCRREGLSRSRRLDCGLQRAAHH
jgi:hypothetical protein